MSEDFYESKIPKMIVCNAFGVACNGRVAKYGVPGNSSSYFADWKDMSVDMTPGKRTHRGGVLLQLYVGRLDHLAPLLGLIGDELAELSGRQRHWNALQVGKSRHQLGIPEALADEVVE
jgi:hypothetical protein